MTSEISDKYTELTPEMTTEFAQFIEELEAQSVPAEEITERVIGGSIVGELQELGYTLEDSETVSSNPSAYRVYLSHGLQFLLVKYPNKRVLTVFIPESRSNQQTEFVQSLSANLKEKIPAEVFIVCGKKVLREDLPPPPAPNARSAALELEYPWYTRMQPGTIVVSPGHDGARAIFVRKSPPPDFVYQFISLATGEPLELKGEEFEQHCEQGVIAYEGDCERVEAWATEKIRDLRRKVAEDAALAANRATPRTRSK
ncbi:MAG: hypothetical protein AAB383_03465 [Patescibacteria group bacterium]